MTRLVSLIILGFFAIGPSLAAAQQADGQTTEHLAERPAAERQVERPGTSGLALPRFVSLRAAEVNLRTGPGIRYPIDWVYRRRGLPVEVIDEFEGWRRIRDHEGTIGWVHQSMLGSRRFGLVLDDPQILRRAPEAGAPGVAQLQSGVIGRLEGCESDWCRLETQGYSGWLKRTALFGLYPDEVFR